MYNKLLFSLTAIENKIDNTPFSIDVVRNLQQLAEFLDSLEKVLGVSILINSGYRTPSLNTIVGGSKNSYHMYGLAADIKVLNTAKCTLTDLKNLCMELRKTRLSEVKLYDTYVHIAIKKY